MTRAAAISASCAIVIAASGSVALAQDFSTQSPGQLTRSHAEFETQCDECHSGSAAVSQAKCLGCHDKQKAKIAKKKGLHSRGSYASQPCVRCHLEHRGRGHDVMGWQAVGGTKSFDHTQTDFALHGKHKVSKCNDCHKRRNKAGVRLYLGESSTCQRCHQKEQPHDLDRGAKSRCSSCHTEISWKPADLSRFDHNKETIFKIEGSHGDVNCTKCHPKSKFNLRLSKVDCKQCHESPHDGHLFSKKRCDSCHSPSLRSLRKVRFNHNRRTKFDLRGKHRKINCYSCHKRRSMRKPKRACDNCHADDNKHGDRFAQFGSPTPACEKCHAGATRWKPAVFNHTKNTEFKLTGKHARAKCRACHRGKKPSQFERFDPKTVACRGCHRHKNSHNGEFKDNQCLECHKAAGIVTPKPEAKNMFHGPGSRFELEDGHKDVQCESCHRSERWSGLETECGPSCHKDSLHRGSLGNKCLRCHQPGLWDATKFDHQKQSEFKLRGLHREVECATCHPQQQFKPRPKNCYGCHEEDDAHRGRLGQKCESCHLETGALIFDHNKQAAFKLTDTHLVTSCKSCHPTLAFKPTAKKCIGCHPEPDVHKGRFGTTCDSCHSTRGWKEIRALHDVGDFSLEGAHDSLRCNECHKDKGQLAGTGPICRTCHNEDDIHASSLGAECGQCHTQWSFAPARFDHTTVGCDLQGLHRTQPCVDCHKSGNFGALSTQCYSCHRDEVAGDGIHNGAAFFNCGDCHNMNYFERPNTAPAMTNSVCR